MAYDKHVASCFIQFNCHRQCPDSTPRKIAVKGCVMLDAILPSNP